MILLLLIGTGIVVVDKATGEPVPCRVHLKDPEGQPVRAPGLPFWRDHFVCRGRVDLDLPEGRYAYEIERGPEWSAARGEIEAGKPLRVELERIADLAKEGWWSGDLHIHRAVDEIELHLAAEDLRVGPVITWWNNTNPWAGRELPADLRRTFEGGRHARTLEGEDERGGGALLYFNLPAPLAIKGSAREHPSALKFLIEAKEAGAHADIEKPFWWDVPVWLASGKADTIGLANNHMCRSTMLDNEAWGRSRDKERHASPRGNGSWTQEIYYAALESGSRIPPSAGSASGVLPNPVGYNRVYVKLDGAFDWGRWWEGLRAGRSFVTNGPLLRAWADGEPPGKVFEGPVEVAVTAELAGRDAVAAVEIVRDGKVERSVPVEQLRRTGSLGKVKFESSGWFLVRAVADNPVTFRFASTAPFHVEVGGKRRVSRAACRFFLDWIDERERRLKLDDPAKRREVLETYESARQSWRARLDGANAD
jgi:hypothetical protein